MEHLPLNVHGFLLDWETLRTDAFGHVSLIFNVKCIRMVPARYPLGITVYSIHSYKFFTIELGKTRYVAKGSNNRPPSLSRKCYQATWNALLTDQFAHAKFVQPAPQ